MSIVYLSSMLVSRRILSNDSYHIGSELLAILFWSRFAQIDVGRRATADMACTRKIMKATKPIRLAVIHFAHFVAVQDRRFSGWLSSGFWPRILITSIEPYWFVLDSLRKTFILFQEVVISPVVAD